MTDRKIGPMGSTTRRFVNLSQFGGPARRVKPGEEVVEDEQPQSSNRTRESSFMSDTKAEYQLLHHAIMPWSQSNRLLKVKHKLVPLDHQTQNQNLGSYTAAVRPWSGDTAKNLPFLRLLSISNRRLVGIGSDQDRRPQSTTEIHIEQKYHPVSKRRQLVPRILAMKVVLSGLSLKAGPSRHTVRLILPRRHPYLSTIRHLLERSFKDQHQLLYRYKVKSDLLRRLRLYLQLSSQQGKRHLLHHRLNHSWITTNAGSS